MGEMRRWALPLLIGIFLALTVPMALERPSGGRSAERQGQTAGVVRIYCQDPSWTPLRAPQVHYGNNPFNLEFTLFEWLEGMLANAIDGPTCDSVEPVSKVINVLVSALGLLVVYWLGATLWSPLSGFIAALLLASDELWMRYASYSMIENRVLVCAGLAIFFSLRRWAIPAFLFWALTLTQKPQIFAFVGPFWVVLELVRAGSLPSVFGMTKSQILSNGPSFKTKLRSLTTIAAFGAALGVGMAYYFWSCRVNEQSDLPWITWMGPRVRRWFMGDWADRFSTTYAKHLALDWVRRSGLIVAVPAVLVLGAAHSRLNALKQLVGRSLPLLAGMLGLTFVFYPVFKVHEYYVLPLNFGFALTCAGVLAFLLEQRIFFDSGKARPRYSFLIHLALICALVGLPAVKGLARYADFVLESRNVDSPIYHRAWNVRVFPPGRGLVVMAIPHSPRDLMHLYLTKRHGFQWCAENKAFAPRAFWKSQGVTHVAWAEGDPDPKSGLFHWTVRTIDEEIAFARKNHWSADGQYDVWAAHSMAEWAAFASGEGLDPCIGSENFDPRRWRR